MNRLSDIPPIVPSAPWKFFGRNRLVVRWGLATLWNLGRMNLPSPDQARLLCFRCKLKADTHE